MQILNFRTLRFLFAVGVVITMVVAPELVFALEVPENVVQTKDKNQIATVANSVISFILYAGMALGAVALAVSLASMLPIFGDEARAKGKQGITVSLAVIFGCGLFEMFVSWVFGLFS